MQTEDNLQSNPVLNTAFLFVMRYFVRFVEIPFLFSIFFLSFFILTTALNDTTLQEKALGVFIWPWFGVFGYPETFHSTNLAPVLLLSSLWLLVFHVIWELLSYLFRKSSRFMPEQKIKTVRRIMWGALIVSLVTLFFANNVTDKWFFAGILLVLTLVGQLSYTISTKMLGAAALGIQWQKDA